MRLSFRQGIVQHQQPDFLNIHGSLVDLTVTDTPLIITLADGSTDYLYVEQKSVTNAWSLVAGMDQWLYWDIDKRTGTRTFGVTYLEPVYDAVAPTSPAADQHWFDVSNRTMKVRVGSRWVAKIRVFACKMASGTTPISMSINAPLFTGTQAGLTEQIYSGQILFDSVTGKPIKNQDGQFITTEDQLTTGTISVSDLKLASLIVSAEAQENLAAYTIVKFSDFGRILHADAFTSSQPGQFGIIQESALTGDLVNVVVTGAISNPSWDWPTVNAYLYVDDTGLIAGTPAQPGSLPIATVVDRTTIILGVPQNNITNATIVGTSVTATDATLGTVRLNIPAVDPEDPIVVGDNDPRLSDDRTPLAHIHDIADVTNLQTTLDGKVDITGDTMTGALTLSGAPTANLHAATKKYVDDYFVPSGHLHSISDVTGLQDALDDKLELAGGTMTGTLTLSGDPINPLEAATKDYVDTLFGSGGSIEPDTQIVYGTGAGVDSSAAFTYDVDTGAFSANYPVTTLPTVGNVRIYGASPSGLALQGGSVVVHGGTGTTTAKGGDITLTSGTGGATGNGGNVNISTGSAAGGTTGQLSLATANAVINQNSGSISITTGTVSGAGTAGTITLNPGGTTPTIFAKDGTISVNSSVGTAGYLLTSGGAGAAATWTAPPAGESQPDTQIVYGTGTGLTSSGKLYYDPTTGEFGLYGLDVPAYNPLTPDPVIGGDIYLQGTAGYDASGSRIVLEAGNGSTDGVSGNRNGGEILLQAGNGGSNDGVGGTINLQAGNSAAGNISNATAGDITLTAGNAGEAAGTQGDIILSGGSNFTIQGTTGALLVNTDAGTAGQVLTSGGALAAPTWASPAGESQPDTQIVYGTGTGISSSSALTFDSTDGTFYVNSGAKSSPGFIAIEGPSVSEGEASPGLGGDAWMFGGWAAADQGGTGGYAAIKGGASPFVGSGPTTNAWGGAVYAYGGAADATGSAGGNIEITAGSIPAVSGQSMTAGTVTIKGGNLVNPGDASAVSGVGDIIIDAGISSGTGAGASYDGNIELKTNNTSRLIIKNAGDWDIGGSVGTAGQVLTSNGASAAPTWQSAAGGVSEPSTQLVYGTGAGVDSAAALTFDATTNALTLAGGTVAAPGNTSLVAAGSAAGVGANITIGGGAGSTGGGNAYVSGGASSAAATGNVFITTPNAVSGQNSGSISITTGTASGAGTSGTISFTVGSTLVGTFSTTGNLILGNAALATTATDGFLHLAGMAGTPTGAPTTATGRYPVTYDSTADKLYVYDGSWIDVTGSPAENEPSTQIVYGTGAGIDSSSTFTFNATTLALSLSGTAASPGNISLSAASHSAAGNGGNVALSGGAGGTTGNGGNVTLSGGTVTSGTAGSVIISTAGTERLEIAGNGEWQVGGSAGTAGYALMSNGAGSAPTWQAVVPTFPLAATSLGTEALPAYTFSGDTNTGIYSPAADKVGITVGAEEVVRFEQDAITFSNGSFATFGDAVSSKYILRILTSDATPTEVLLNGAGRMALQNDSSWTFTVTVIARDISTGDTGSYELRGAIKRGANAAATTLVGTVTKSILAEDAGASTWDANATADTSNGSLKIEVTGAAATDIRWVAVVDTVEVVG